MRKIVYLVTIVVFSAFLFAEPVQRPQDNTPPAQKNLPPAQPPQKAPQIKKPIIDSVEVGPLKDGKVEVTIQVRSNARIQNASLIIEKPHSPDTEWLTHDDFKEIKPGVWKGKKLITVASSLEPSGQYKISEVGVTNAGKLNSEDFTFNGKSPTFEVKNPNPATKPIIDSVEVGPLKDGKVEVTIQVRSNARIQNASLIIEKPHSPNTEWLTHDDFKEIKPGVWKGKKLITVASSLEPSGQYKISEVGVTNAGKLNSEDFTFNGKPPTFEVKNPNPATKPIIDSVEVGPLKDGKVEVTIQVRSNARIQNASLIIEKPHSPNTEWLTHDDFKEIKPGVWKGKKLITVASSLEPSGQYKISEVGVTNAGKLNSEDFTFNGKPPTFEVKNPNTLEAPLISEVLSKQISEDEWQLTIQVKSSSPIKEFRMATFTGNLQTSISGTNFKEVRPGVYEHQLLRIPKYAPDGTYHFFVEDEQGLKSISDKLYELNFITRNLSPRAQVFLQKEELIPYEDHGAIHELFDEIHHVAFKQNKAGSVDADRLLLIPRSLVALLNHGLELKFATLSNRLNGGTTETDSNKELADQEWITSILLNFLPMKDEASRKHGIMFLAEFIKEKSKSRSTLDSALKQNPWIEAALRVLHSGLYREGLRVGRKADHTPVHNLGPGPLDLEYVASLIKSYHFISADNDQEIKRLEKLKTLLDRKFQSEDSKGGKEHRKIFFEGLMKMLGGSEDFTYRNQAAFLSLSPHSSYDNFIRSDDFQRPLQGQKRNQEQGRPHVRPSTHR